MSSQHVQPSITYNSHQPTSGEPRESLSIEQINENLKRSSEPKNINQPNPAQSAPPVQSQNHPVHNRRSSLPDLKIFNFENKNILQKKISLETVQQLLSQKQFVRQMLNKSPKFLEIVTEEVKEKVYKELQGILNKMK
jgi:hypothetical protein